MRILAVVVLALATACSGGGRERVWCDKGGELCGDPSGAGECVDQMKKLKEPFGDTYDPLLSCGTAATSCAEFVGCFAGGIDQIAKIFGKDFERGFDRMTVRTDDPKHDGWRIHDHGSADDRTTTTTTTTHDSHHFDQHDGDPPKAATTCAKFAGEPLDAKWDDCTDHVRRELVCAKGAFESLECQCVEDGVEKWRFDARDPHLDNQDEATRIARSNCHMSFEGF